MLHIKVLSYEEYDNTTLDNLDEKYFKLKKKEKTCTGFEDAEFLCDTHTVERRFIEILNTDFDTMEYMGETYLDSSRHSHKNFLEVIMWETLAVDCCSYSWIKGIITDETKKALNDSYLDCVKWGFSIDTETKEIKICEPHQAITDFHEAVQHAVEDDETY